MLPLCEELKISVNELLSGEKIPEENYRKKAEENMVDLVREKEESKKKITISAIVAMVGVSVLVVMILLVCSMTDILTVPIKVLLVLFGGIVFVLGIGVAVVLDRDAGTFECPKCQTRFTPDMTAYIMGPHTITKRYLKCPHCNESSYCRKRLTR